MVSFLRVIFRRFRIRSRCSLMKSSLFIQSPRHSYLMKSFPYIAFTSSKTFFMPSPSFDGVHIFFGFQFFHSPSYSCAPGSYSGLSTHCPPSYNIRIASGVSLPILQTGVLYQGAPRSRKISIPCVGNPCISICNQPRATVRMKTPDHRPQGFPRKRLRFPNLPA